MIMNPFSISMLALSVLSGSALGMFLVFLVRFAYDPFREYGITYAGALRRMYSSLFSHNLMLFDFDDTLYPTTVIDERNVSNVELSGFPEDLRERMAEIDVSALALVRDCWSRGTVFIVTNSNGAWIGRRFQLRHMPRLFQFLRDKRIRVVSARDAYEATEEQPRWKFFSFRALVEAFQLRLWFKQKVCVLSIGDRENDRDATMGLSDQSFGLGHVRGENIRFVMFRLFPSPAMLRDELRVLRMRIRSILYAGRQTDNNMADIMLAVS